MKRLLTILFLFVSVCSFAQIDTSKWQSNLYPGWKYEGMRIKNLIIGSDTVTNKVANSVVSLNNAMYVKAPSAWVAVTGYTDSAARAALSGSLNNKFSQGGNSFGSTATLGTTSNPLRIVANNVEHQYFTDDSMRSTIGTSQISIKHNPANTSAGRWVGGWSGNYIDSGYNNIILWGGANNFPNRILGNSFLRSILHGYHNTIEASDASMILSMHSFIGRGANHGTINGASWDTITSGGYTGIYNSQFTRIGKSDPLDPGVGNSWSTIVGSQQSYIQDSCWFCFQGGVKSSYMMNNARSGQYSVDQTWMKNSLSSAQIGGWFNDMDTVTRGVQAGGKLNHIRNSTDVFQTACFDCLIKNTNNSATIATISSTINGGSTNTAISGSSHVIENGTGQTSIGGGHYFNGSSVNDFSTAIGLENRIGGLGIRTQAAIGIGRGNIVSGDYSVAIGDSNTANGKNVFAIGYHANNTGQGSMLFTDGTGTGASNSITHKFVGSFLNGWDFQGSRGITIPSRTSFQILNIVSPVDGERVFNNQKSETWIRNGNTNKWRTEATTDTLGVFSNLKVSGGIITSGSTPTVTAGAAAGTSPTISVVGNDIRGTITLTTGTSPTTGTLFTITFSSTLTNIPVYFIQATNTMARSEMTRYRTDQPSATTSSETFQADIAPTASTTYKWNYLNIQ